MKAALIVILVLFVLAMIWLGVEVRFWDSRLTVYARVFFIKFKVWPGRKKPKKKPKKDEKDKKTEKEASHKVGKEKPKLKPDIRGLIELGIKAAGRLKRKITVSNITLRYTAGSRDPSDTALQYGRVSAAVGILLPRICEAFKVKRHDVRVDADFDLLKPEVEFEGAVGMFLWQLIYVGVSALTDFIRLQNSGK